MIELTLDFYAGFHTRGQTELTYVGGNLPRDVRGEEGIT